MGGHGVRVGVDVAGLLKYERPPVDAARHLYDATFRGVDQDGALDVWVQFEGNLPLDPAHAGPAGRERVAVRGDAQEVVEDDEIVVFRLRRQGHSRCSDQRRNCNQFVCFHWRFSFLCMTKSVWGASRMVLADVLAGGFRRAEAADEADAVPDVRQEHSKRRQKPHQRVRGE